MKAQKQQKSPKVVGDVVCVTAGKRLGQVGTLIAKERRGWSIKFKDGKKETVAFPWIVLEPQPKAGDKNGKVSSKPEIGPDGSLEVGFTIDEIKAGQDGKSDAPREAAKESRGSRKKTAEQHDPASETKDISEMSVKELQRLAKQRGVSVARTKTDFFRIIKEKNPEEDMDRLKGKVLFDRVGELHISRLRSKGDLVNLLKA